MTAETTEEPFVNPWHAYQSHTTHWSQGSLHRQSHGWIWTGKLPWHGICLPCQVSNVEIEAKTTKKQEKGTKKRKLDFKGMTQTTLDHWLFKPKTPTRVRFKEWVLLRVGPRCPWRGSPIRGAFAHKHLQTKRSMAHQHCWCRQRLTAINVKRGLHSHTKKNDARKHQTWILTVSFSTESQGTINGGSMTLVRLDKFKKDTVLTEVLLVKDTKG